MSNTTLNFAHTVEGVPTNATSVKLRDPTNTFGVQRKDNNAIVVPSDTLFSSTGVGQYTYTFADPASDLVYRYYIEVKFGSLTNYIERETSIGQSVNLVVNGRYASYAGMRAKYGTSNLQQWGAVDGTENQAAIIEAITAAIVAADNYIDSLLLGGPYIVPFTSGSVPPLIKEVADVLAGVLLYEAQSVMDAAQSDNEADAQGRLRMQRVMAMRTLARIKVGDIRLMLTNGTQLDKATGVPSAGVDPVLIMQNGLLTYVDEDELPYNLLKIY